MRILLCLSLALLSSMAYAQPDEPDAIPALVARLEKVLLSSDASTFRTLLSPNAAPDVEPQFGSRLFLNGTTRVVIREREREALPGALPGDGYRLVLEILTEAGTRARILTVKVDARRPRNDTSRDAWGIVSGTVLTHVDGLHRVGVNTTQQYAARNFTLRSEDVSLTLLEGFLFPVDSEAGVSGMVLLGRGMMEFTPGLRTEREQLRLFSGADSLRAEFDTAFVRLNPGAFDASPGSGLTPAPADVRQVRRAQEVFAAEAPRSFSLDLGDLTREQWYLIPTEGDFLAEIRTRRNGTLTYARSGAESEDVTLFERARGRDIARYASEEKLRSRGVSYNEDDLADYDVLAYDVEISLSPARALTIEGRTQLLLRVRAPTLSTVNVKLAEELEVQSAESPELGRLSHLRVRTRNNVVLNLPVPLRKNTEITIIVSYRGRMVSQSIDQEALQSSLPESRPDLMTEPHYLLSGRSYWYPQSSVTDYAPARLTVTVPGGLECVASGELESVSPVTTAQSRPGARVYVFNAREPLRYLAVLVSRFRSQGKTDVAVADPRAAASSDVKGPRTAAVRDRVNVSVEANPRQAGYGREITASTTDIVGFYASLMGDAPYAGLTVAIVEDQFAGGHSPGYLVMVNSPPAGAQFSPRNDPASFPNFPEFVLAHELAHQWWGQAVGWKNYHEQWLSEGVAQYFAALYAEHRHGQDAFTAVLRQARRWALDESDQGPISLGYRLGQIRGDKRVLRAVMYNKGAGVLHMLRRLVGDEVFFASLRRLYRERKFEKAGTDDLRRAFEMELGTSLERFFERWVFDSSVPRVRYRWSAGEDVVVVNFEQQGDDVFDIPVTVTVSYADRRETDTFVVLDGKTTEHRIPVNGPVRSIQINRDSGALAEFVQG